MVATAEIIAIAEVCVYIPIFILTIIVLFRHGFQKQLGWIYLAIFAAIRAAGAGFKISSEISPNKTNIEWAAILQSVGLSPLLLASMGLLKRITDEVSNHTRSEQSHALQGIADHTIVGKLVSKRATANSRRSRIIQISQIPTMIALILCIVGGIDQSDNTPSEISSGKKDTKIGVIIFLGIYLLLTVLVVITMKDVGNAPRGEKRIYFAVLAAIPLLGVRLLWSFLSAFANNPDFSIIGGKPLIQLFMAVLEEFVIVCMYTLAGLTVAY
jgi:hypothetical protein